MPYGPSPRGKRPSKESRPKESSPNSIQITVDLAPADYQLLNLWLARASIELDQPVSEMTLARGIRALIQAAGADRAVNDVALGIMRKELS